MYEDLYYFAFSSGSGVIVSLLGLFIHLISFSLFKPTKLQKLLLFVDSLMLGICLSSFIHEKTKSYWIILAISYSVFMMNFSLYGTSKIFHMLPTPFRILIIVGNIVVFVAYLLFTFGLHGFLPTRLATVLLMLILPFPVAISVAVSYKVIKIITGNPLHYQDTKQMNLIRISKMTIIIALSFATPAIFMILPGGYFENLKLVYLGIVFLPFIKLVFTISNFCITFNKSLENKDNGNIQGLSVFNHNEYQLSIIQNYRNPLTNHRQL